MTQNTLYPRTKPKGRGVIPFGYTHNKDTNMLEAIPGYLEVLEDTVNKLLDESISSLREGLVYIKSELGQDVKISHQTLSNYLEKAGGKPTRQYTYHYEVKAKMSAKKAFNQNKNTVKALEKQLTKAKKTLKKKTPILTDTNTKLRGHRYTYTYISKYINTYSCAREKVFGSSPTFKVDHGLK